MYYLAGSLAPPQLKSIYCFESICLGINDVCSLSIVFARYWAAGVVFLDSPDLPVDLHPAQAAYLTSLILANTTNPLHFTSALLLFINSSPLIFYHLLRIYIDSFKIPIEKNKFVPLTSEKSLCTTSRVGSQKPPLTLPPYPPFFSFIRTSSTH
jgi:hypothetical protein